ncbi:MAG: TonB family protein [Nitrospirota bacterium]
MSDRLLLDVSGSLHFHREIKFTWLVLSSVLGHLCFALVLFMVMPSTSRKPPLIQEYYVSLVSQQQFQLKEGPAIPLVSIPTPLPLIDTPPAQKESAVNIETEKVIPIKLPLQSKRVDAIADLSAKKIEPVVAVGPLLPNPVLENTAKNNSPSVPSENGLSAMTSEEAVNKARGSAGSSSFNYPYYLRSIEQKIGMQWAPPPAMTISSNREGSVAMIGFVVKRDGRIDLKSVSIEKSSGNTFFDMAAMRAVHNANPFPPLPIGILEDLRVHFRFASGFDS